jgi:hypothetical protein
MIDSVEEADIPARSPNFFCELLSVREVVRVYPFEVNPGELAECRLGCGTHQHPSTAWDTSVMIVHPSVFGRCRRSRHDVVDRFSYPFGRSVKSPEMADTLAGKIR